MIAANRESRPLEGRDSRRAWIIYVVGVLAYLIAVAQRSSLGVAGVAATERFEVAAAALSSLAVVQLVIYAGLQIPVGILIDRVGPKRLLIAGAVLMAAGQFLLAGAPTLTIAVIGRVLVGAGDAMTFISVIRIVMSWFSGRLVPHLTQWLGTLGQFGQIVAAVPLALVLRDWGWSTAFVSAGALSVLALVLVAALLRDAPGSAAAANPDEPRTLRVLLRELGAALRRPGTRLGFWCHFLLQSPSNTLAVLWGFPLFSVGLGFGPAGASLLLVVMVVAAAIAGPLFGQFSARYPMRRTVLVIGVLVTMLVALGVLLLWPGLPPFWLVALVVSVLAAGGPGSLIGLDVARVFNPAHSLGSVNGLVNMGGFLATLSATLLVGVVLDALDLAAGGAAVPGELYAFDRFRIALLVIVVVCAFGAVMMFHARRQTRRQLAAEGVVIDPLAVAVRRRWQARGGA